ncbi:DNA polymerase III subunit beta [Tengunoibacter tsumagoiensis]|uniref:DNA polymerase III subunit beta n=1 Tax=Tengunoibacter tsumagoiensis TaxID=2014871 RepID=A0A402A7T7_9CHLR|nr:DNA polymerase III subunit beta [Tengunoibacter tsumagoiensis]GCE15075.1 DNA polymerase III subunit beta [Tengunoibacter tsumagoiensis]
MKFTAKQQNLHRGLTIVRHAVPTNGPFPIQKYILATANGGHVRLSARREDLGIHYWITTEAIDDEGVALLPAYLLSDFVRNVPAASIIVTSPSPLHTDSCHVRCLRSSADMKNATDDPAEFTQPPLFQEGGELLIQLDAWRLKEIIAQTAFAAAEKEGNSWSWAVGLRIEIAEGKALFAATDSFRLAMYTLPVPDDQLRCRLLIPAKTMQEMAKLLPNGGTVQMLLTPDRNMALFHSDIAHLSEAVDVSTRLLRSENYPSLEHAVPSSWTTRALISTQELASKVKLMLPYAHDNRYEIHFKFFGEQTERVSLAEVAHTIAVETFATDVGTIENMIPAQVQGPDQEITLHARYLLEVLEVLTTAQVALEVTDGNRPAVLRPIGPEEYVYVMMPIKKKEAGAKR